MPDMATMKARIALELRRNDLSAQINDAIRSAIECYQDERWWFNESREATFDTVANQEFYSKTDDADIGLIEKIDYIKLDVDGTPFTLRALEAEKIEALSQNGTQTGEPLYYSFYGQKIRLYPAPAIVYTVRIAGVIKVAAPLDDGETGNVWMEDCERLIRARAKYELATQVLIDRDIAELAMVSIENAYTQLRRRTAQKTQTGGWCIAPTTF